MATESTRKYIALMFVLLYAVWFSIFASQVLAPCISLHEFTETLSGAQNAVS